MTLENRCLLNNHSINAVLQFNDMKELRDKNTKGEKKREESCRTPAAEVAQR